jgi:hypothetical protein
MLSSKQILMREIKNVFINLAKEDKLPLDITTLDMGFILDEAEKNLHKDDAYRKTLAIEKLGTFVSAADVSKALDKLVKQSEKDGGVLADDVVLMWEPFVDYFTVDELLEMVNY